MEEQFVLLFCLLLVLGGGAVIVRAVSDSCDCGLCRRVSGRRKVCVEVPTPPRKAWVVVQTPGHETFVGLNEFVPD